MEFFINFDLYQKAYIFLERFQAILRIETTAKKKKIISIKLLRKF